MAARTIEDAPFLRIRLDGGVAQVEGATSRCLGQVGLPEELRTGQEVFGEWHWDGAQVTVRTCRFGFFPLYYYATANEFGVSSSVPRLIECGAPTELDEAAFATFLRLGWLLGDDTLFRAIRRVPPNGEVRWSGGAPSVTGQPWFPRPQQLSRAAAIEGFGELFRQAMRRRTSAGVSFALPLSGGRDSRHILLELNALGCRPKACFTTHDFPPFRTGNIRVAAMLCQRLGIPHRVVPPPAARLKAEVRKNEVTSFGVLEKPWGVPFFKALSNITTLVYDGLAGDALTTGAWAYLDVESVKLLDRGDLDELARRVIGYWNGGRFGEDTLARLLPPEALRRYPTEFAVRRAAQEIGKHSGAAIPLGSFNFWNRTRRAASLGPFALAVDAGIQAITPYLDHDLFEFLASLPAAMLTDKAFHTEAMHRIHPEFRDVPFSDELKLSRQDRPLQDRRFLVEAAAFVAFNSRGRLLQRVPTARRLLALSLARGKGLIRRADAWVAPMHAIALAQLEALCRTSPGEAPF